MLATYHRLNVATWASNREVICAARLKLTREAKGRAWRSTRHAFLRRMLAHHEAAQALCKAFSL